MKTVLTKIIIVFVALIFSSETAKSQDTLVLTNGTKISSKIVEINSNEIKYKKTDNPDGPFFITNKTDVAFIKYQNGTSDTLGALKSRVEEVPVVSKPVIVENPKLYPAGSKYLLGDKKISENQMYRKVLSMNDPQLSKIVKKAKVGKGMQFIGLVAIPALVAGVGCMIYNGVTEINNANSFNDPQNDSYTSPEPFLAIGVACLATSIAFKIQYKHSNRAIVKLYNQKY